MKTAALYTIAVILTSTFALGQQYKVLYSFAGSQTGDGYKPVSNLILDHAGNLYGTTLFGGTGGGGTVFELSPNSDGTWTETILHNFCTTIVNHFCLDGAYPRAGLIFDSQGSLYGTTSGGGSNAGCSAGLSGCGTVFRLSPPSSPGGEWRGSVLYNFCSVGSHCTDGTVPYGAVTLDSLGNLYGTTTAGGSGHVLNGGSHFQGGVVFELSPGANGWTENVLYNFCTLGEGNFCPDGALPQAGVTFDKSGNLFGTTETGGALRSQGGGTVYKLLLGANGWTEDVLEASTLPFPNGAYPLGTVSFDTLGNLYSTLSAAGPLGGGSVFRIGPKGSATTFLFDGSNGALPDAGVLVDSEHSTLYGTTQYGGVNREGTAFQIVGPSQATVLYSFCSQANCTDGDFPAASLIQDKAGNLYGTTPSGGLPSCYEGIGCGVVFEITP
jgi:uncharacterized repeat protein (TIGR03803 family)